MGQGFKPREDLQKESKKDRPDKKKTKRKKGLVSSYQSKAITGLVWLFILVLFGGAFNFLLKEVQIYSQLKHLKKEVVRQEQALDNLKANSESSGNFDVFNRSFIVSYYNTKSDPTNYQDTLKVFFPKDTTLPINNPNNDAKKILSIQLWEKKKDQGIYKVKYLIDYQVNDQRKRELLCYNVKEKNNKYIVQAIPYKQIPDKMTNQDIMKVELMPQLSEDQLEESKKKEFQEWLDKTFFPKYIETSDKSVVKYMMKQPEVLGGATEYKGIQEIVAYDKGKHIECYVIVRVTDRGTKQEYLNNYKLIVIKDEKDQYFIEKMQHQFN
jgi:hypothetical protein